ATAARIQVDHERTADLVRQIPRTPVLAASTPVPTTEERVCKHAQETDAEILSFQEMELILGYRGSNAACKRIAQQIWQLTQNRQRSPRGEPSKMRLIVKVLSATPGTIDAALTDENQKANRVDLRITNEVALTKPPVPGAMIDIMGFISDYSVSPFMF